jgi:hypothetical protein
LINLGAREVRLVGRLGPSPFSGAPASLVKEKKKQQEKEEEWKKWDKEEADHLRPRRRPTTDRPPLLARGAAGGRSPRPSSRSTMNPASFSWGLRLLPQPSHLYNSFFS